MKKAILVNLVHDESHTEIFENLQQLKHELKYKFNAYLRSNANVCEYKKYLKLSNRNILKHNPYSLFNKTTFTSLHWKFCLIAKISSSQLSIIKQRGFHCGFHDFNFNASAIASVISSCIAKDPTTW